MDKIRPVQKIALSYYARKDIQQAIYEFCKNRETIPRYLEGFGKRPDTLDYPSDILIHVKKGATSFHCSEEIWENPLDISKDMTPEQLNQLKSGWDFLIDIDSKYLDYSKIAADLIIKVLEYHSVKNIGIKFSGSKGFHIIIPWNSFPEEVDGELTKNHFPEWARLIAGYIQEMVHDRLVDKIIEISDTKKLGKVLFEVKCKKCHNKAVEQNISQYKCSNCRAEVNSMKSVKKTLRCPGCNFDMDKIGEQELFTCLNCETNSQKNPNQFEKKPTASALIDSVDIVLVAPRHLFRAPYSLHEKTSLASIVIEKTEIQTFDPKYADPLKIKIKNFAPETQKAEARELLMQALDWQKRKTKPKKSFTGKSINLKNLTINESMFPPCVQKILSGIKQDGRKRALFILLSFFSSLEFPREFVEEKLEKWNKKNYKPLREGYIQSQLNWFAKNKIMPPNCDKSYYKEIGVLCSCQNIKNPVNFTIKQALKSKGANEKTS